MDNRCGLCGCKTDALDLTEYQFPTGEKAFVCDYCRRQLMSYSKDPKSNGKWARDVFTTDTKGARSPEISAAFFGMMKANGTSVVPAASIPPAVNPTPPKASALPFGQNTVQSAEPLTESGDELAEVKKQLADLNDRFEKFRKRYLLSKVLGIVLPIVFVIIMVIILFASGAVQNLFDYYAQLSEYANY